MKIKKVDYSNGENIIYDSGVYGTPDSDNIIVIRNDNESVSLYKNGILVPYADRVDYICIQQLKENIRFVSIRNNGRFSLYNDDNIVILNDTTATFADSNGVIYQ